MTTPPTKDERIAPPTANSQAETEAVPTDAATEATTDAATEAPASRLPRKRALGIAGAAVALCVVLVVGGISLGLLNGEDAALTEEQFMGAASGMTSKSPSSITKEELERAEASLETTDGEDNEAHSEEQAASNGEGEGADAPEDTSEQPLAEGVEDAAALTDAPDQTQPETQPDSGAAAEDDTPQAGAQAPTQTPSASSPSEQPSTPQPETPAEQPEKPATITVNVAIDSSRAVPVGYAASMGGGTVTVNEGASVYDALCATGVAVGGSSGYVSSIGGLAEFACGSGSGWLYFVNGVSPSVGCDSYVLKNGDSVTWIYTLDLGNDL